MRISAHGLADLSSATTARSLGSQRRSVFQVNKCSGRWKSPVATDGRPHSATQSKRSSRSRARTGRPLRQPTRDVRRSRRCLGARPALSRADTDAPRSAPHQLHERRPGRLLGRRRPRRNGAARPRRRGRPAADRDPRWSARAPAGGAALTACAPVQPRRRSRRGTRRTSPPERDGRLRCGRRDR